MFTSDIIVFIQKKMKEQHKKELKELEVNTTKVLFVECAVNCIRNVCALEENYIET